MHDDDLSEQQRQLRDSLARVMGDFATPDTLRRLDREAAYPEEAYRAWVGLGLLGLGIPEQYGGVGGGMADLALVSEDLAYWSYDVSTAYTVPLFSALTVLRCGREEQKAELLPALAAGRLRLSVCISEPDAGSDVSAIRTRAARDGHGWVLSGQKLWATAAGAPDNVMLVYARSDPDAPPRQGMSVFLVANDLPGVQCRKLDMLGRRATGSYEVFLDEVRLPADRVLGEPGQGWRYLLSGLQAERALTSAGYVGAAQKVVDLAAAYAGERRQFGKPIAAHQAIAHMLADMQTEVEAARLLAHRAAIRMDRGLDSLREVSMAKLYGSETYARVANQGMQIMGAHGYSMEHEMQRHFRDARSTTIGAGTSQMQRSLIASTMGLSAR